VRVSHSYLSQLEHGYIEHPSGDRLRVLADLYKVPRRWVLEKAGLLYQAENSAPSTLNIPEEALRLALRIYRHGPAALKAVEKVIEAIEEGQKLAGRKGSQ